MQLCERDRDRDAARVFERFIGSMHRFEASYLIVAARSATAKVFRNPAVASIRAI